MKKVILCWLFLGLLVGGGACLGFSDLFGGSREPGEDEFKCGSSGKIIPKSFLNDDFCDCLEDGSDEPLTGLFCGLLCGLFLFLFVLFSVCFILFYFILTKISFPRRLLQWKI